jgi:hypothetical protein
VVALMREPLVAVLSSKYPLMNDSEEGLFLFALALDPQGRIYRLSLERYLHPTSPAPISSASTQHPSNLPHFSSINGC